MAIAVRSPRPVVPAILIRGRARWALGGGLLLALALRARYLSTSLGMDEGGVAFIARNWPSGHGSLDGSHWLDRPPLLGALYKLAVGRGDAGVLVLMRIGARRRAAAPAPAMTALPH